MRDGAVVCVLLAVLAPAARAEDVKVNPMDEALRLIKRARAAYAKVRDYQCILIKREKMEAELGPNQIIDFKVRARPFSVNMRWNEPKSNEGQEVCYVDGKYDGKMRVKPAGLLGSIGFVSLATDDARAKKTSRHPITSAGIGNLIEMCGKGWEAERNLGKTIVKVGTFTYAKRKCTRVEMIHPTNADGRLLYHKNIVYFDQATHLPIRVENYDWPAKPGAAPELVEVFSYVNLRLNVDLPDSTFER